MGMSYAAEHWTAARVRALPDDGNRYELVSGELVVTPSPRMLHQRAVQHLVRLLDPWVRNTKAAELLMSPADLSLGEDETLQPDLFVFPVEPGRPVRNWADVRSLLLVIEVLSPSTARHDRTLKRLRYQRAGVPEYWIVDPDARLIECWRPDDARPEILTGRLVWQLEEGKPGLEVDLAAMFAEMHGQG